VKSIVILISGRGSNLVAIAEALAEQRWPARIAAVISSRRDAAGLARASAMGLPAIALDHRDFEKRADFEAALLASIDEHAPDVLALAGFTRVLSADFVGRFAGRMLNVHPSLLPSFPGLHTHRQALAAGVRIHGATVHFVTAELDHGPIVAQAGVTVAPDDTEQTLAERVLAEEHVIYPRALRWFIEGRLSIDGARVAIAADDRADAASLALVRAA
jgi:phosphoribosylglycinamide formyltransferase-1